jgi:hypothetical protein
MSRDQTGRRPNRTKDAAEILGKINRAKTEQALLQSTSSSPEEPELVVLPPQAAACTSSMPARNRRSARPIAK